MEVQHAFSSKDLRLSKSRFMNEARSKVPDFNQTLVGKAWDVAEAAHANQFRDSGEPYFYHPVDVAYSLLTVNCDSESLAAALLVAAQ